MARGRRGGYQQPASPAPVSGPGALSQRTDGGPGQPVRVAPGGAYGERKAMEQLQQSAPMAAGGGASPLPATGGGPQPQAPSPAPIMNLTGPTTRPYEPINSRLGSSKYRNAEVEGVLKLMYDLVPDEALGRLINDRSM